MAAPIVFFDIAGPDSEVTNNFYSDLFSWDIAPGDSVTVPIASPTEVPPSLMGTLRQDSAEKMLYIGVDDITATLAAIVEQGGQIDQPRFEVPGVVILGLFRDPAGNRLGLVEMENGRAKVP
jgi:hypothetical protein